MGQAMAEITQRMKARTQSATRYAVATGKLKKLPCSVCGTRKKVEAHHTDYTKPLEVVWLCQYHHHEYHRLNPKVTNRIGYYENPNVKYKRLVTLTNDISSLLGRVVNEIYN